MAEKPAKDMTIDELLADVKGLPNTERSIMSHNERVLIELAQALGAKLSNFTSVGKAGSMPGTYGFTMAAFRTADVPVGTKLFRETP